MAKGERKPLRPRDGRQPGDGQTQPMLSGSGSDDSRIRERAYEIYLERGEGPGDEMADWLRAERELQQFARRLRAQS